MVHLRQHDQSNCSPLFEVTECYPVGRTKLLSLMKDLRGSGLYRASVFKTRESIGSDSGVAGSYCSEGTLGFISGIEIEVSRRIGQSETGLIFFVGEDRALVLSPPFPVLADANFPDVETTPVVEMFTREILIGLVLLRLGRFAVGLLDRMDLIASKTGTRYVKSRHRAGGSSQRRFERSRERLIRELFDTVCKTTGVVFSQAGREVDYILLGGERHTIEAFKKRCKLFQFSSNITLNRLLPVARPGLVTLKQIHREVWKSRVIELKRIG